MWVIYLGNTTEKYRQEKVTESNGEETSPQRCVVRVTAVRSS